MAMSFFYEIRMSLGSPFFFFLLGLLLICKGGDWFVDAASYLALAFGIPKYIIGATIVSFATTLPEMIVSVAAAIKGSSAMAIGNAVGSVSANTGLIMGISLIFLPVAIRLSDYLLKTILYLGCLILLLLAFCDGCFDPSDCILLLLSGALFLGMNVRTVLLENQVKKRERETKKLRKNMVFFFLGAGAIIAGSEFLVQSACAIALGLHLPEAIISVTILAMGTSLPELVTTISAILKKESSLSIGNIVGANVIDSAFILPVCTLITGKPLDVSREMAYIDLPVCLLISVIALVPMLIRKRIRRTDGIAVVLVYLAYFLSLSQR